MNSIKVGDIIRLVSYKEALKTVRGNSRLTRSDGIYLNINMKYLFNKEYRVKDISFKRLPCIDRWILSKEWFTIVNKKLVRTNK